MQIKFQKHMQHKQKRCEKEPPKKAIRSACTLAHPGTAPIQVTLAATHHPPCFHGNSPTLMPSHPTPAKGSREKKKKGVDDCLSVLFSQLPRMLYLRTACSETLMLRERKASMADRSFSSLMGELLLGPCFTTLAARRLPVEEAAMWWGCGDVGKRGVEKDTHHAHPHHKRGDKRMDARRAGDTTTAPSQTWFGVSG